MRIAVAAYGSIINNLHSTNYGATLHVTNEGFQKSTLKFPVRLGRLSSKNTDRERVTAIISSDGGVPVSIYIATHCNSDLSKALKNLRNREGTTAVENVGFIRIGVPQNGSNFRKITLANGTIVSTRNRNLSDATAKKIVKWMLQKGYEAMIFADFGKNGGTTQEIKRHLDTHPATKERSQKYYNDLPAPVKTALKQNAKNLGLSN